MIYQNIVKCQKITSIARGRFAPTGAIDYSNAWLEKFGLHSFFTVSDVCGRDFMSIMWMRITHWQSVLPQKEAPCSTECRNFGRRTLFTAHWKIIENRQRFCAHSCSGRITLTACCSYGP